MMKHKYAFAALAALATTFASAATWTVTSTGDNASDPATLRGAIAAAADGDTITFDASLAGGTIALDKTLGPLEYAGSLTIEGPASAPVTIDGGAGAVDQGIAYAGNSRTIYLIHATGTVATTTLKNLVFTGSKTTQAVGTPDVGPAVSILGSAVIDNCCWTNNGVARSGNFSQNDGGGCLRVVGDLTLSNSTFVKNGAHGASGNYVIGGAVCAKGANVFVTNCVFSETYGWDGSLSGANDLGTLAFASTVTSATVVDTLFEKNAAGHGPGGIYIYGAGASSRYTVRHCAFRENWGANSSIRHGAAMGMGNQGNLVVEDTEFDLGRANGWGPALRVDNGSSKVVLANCTFVNNDGYEWGGGAVDTRCDTWYVNCTAAGNVNRANDVRGSTFYVWKTVNVLNSAVVWNYYKNGAEINDISRYQGTLNAYNSYFHTAGNGPQTKVDVRDYDENTKFFADPMQTVSSFSIFGQTLTHSSPISTPVLRNDAADPDAARVVAIDKTGVLFRTGWPVKHDANWENIAYSQDGGSTWTALRGSADAATIPLAADARGEAYPIVDGVPLPPIGSATVPLHTMTWDVGTNGGTMEVGGATVSTTASTIVIDGDAPVPPGTPEKSGCNFVGWNTDPDATTALDLTAVSADDDETYYAIFKDASSTALVNWYDEDGTTLLGATSVDTGDQPTFPDPEKPADAQYTYPLAGWIDMDAPGAAAVPTASLPAVAGGTTVNYKASYAPTLRAYAIVFENWDGTVLQTNILDYGTAIVAPADPSRPPTVDYSFSFAGWSPVLASGATVTGAVVYAAVYAAAENTVSVDSAGYEHRMTFTVTGYDGSETLENFPVLVRLSTTMTKDGTTASGFSYADFAPGGADVRFVLGDGTASGSLLVHEIDTWDATGESTVWVSLPSVTNGTTFTMLWSLADGAVEPEAFTPARVWTKADYLGVWHFNTAEGGVYVNAAGGGHDGVPAAAATEYVVGGAVGGYVKPASGGIFVEDSADWVDFVTNVTAELWLDRDGGNTGWLFGSGGDDMIRQGAAIRMDGYIIGNGIHSNQRQNFVPASDWHHLVVNFRNDGSPVVVVDGETSLSFWRGGGDAIDGNNSHFFHNASDTTYMNDTYRSFAKLSLTSRGDGNSSYTAFADEFRFRRGGSSTDWIQASWDTSVVGSTFLSNGGVASTGGTKISGIEAAPSWTQASVTGTFSVQIGSDPFPATLTVDGVTRTGTISDAAASFTTIFTNLLPGTSYTATFAATVDGTPVSTNLTFTTTALPAPSVASIGIGPSAGQVAVEADFSTELSDWTVRVDFVPSAESGTSAAIVADDDGTSCVSAAAGGLDRDAVYVAFFRILAADGTTVVVSTEGVTFTVGGYPVIDAQGFLQEWTFTVTNHVSEDGKAVLDEVNYLPVPLRLSPGDPEGFSPNRYAGGTRLRAMQDGQSLPIEVETWDPEGECVVWVGVPVVTNGVTISLLALPRSGAALPAARPERVWTRAGYVGVWHMGGDDPTAESTGLVGTPETANLSAPAVDETRPGPLGRSLASLRTSRFDLPGETTAAWDLSNGFSLETWLTPSSYNYARIFSAANTYDRQLSQTIGQTQFFLGNMDNHGPNAGWHEAGTTNGWEHLQYVYSGAVIGSSGRVYENGVSRIGVTTSKADIALSDGLGLISYRGGTDSGLAGGMDEIRIRLVPSTEAWQRANYLAMNPVVPYTDIELARDVPSGLIILLR